MQEKLEDWRRSVEKSLGIKTHILTLHFVKTVKMGKQFQAIEKDIISSTEEIANEVSGQ